MAMVQTLSSEDYFAWVVAATLFFLGIYALFASLAWWMARILNRPISLKPLRVGQVTTEITQSLRTILIFGVGIVVPVWMVNAGVANVNMQATWMQILLDSVLLIAWNDLHFYAMHRLLHRYFKRAHGVHHQSNVSTPFAAYSMSVTEAMLLGAVMPLIMPFHAFSIESLLFLPVWSIIINTLAHSNCDVFPKASPKNVLGFIKHHQHHHSFYQGNFGFFFSQWDTWLGTSQPSNNSQPSTIINNKESS